MASTEDLNCFIVSSVRTSSTSSQACSSRTVAISFNIAFNSRVSLRTRFRISVMRIHLERLARMALFPAGRGPGKTGKRLWPDGYLGNGTQLHLNAILVLLVHLHPVNSS